ncbi:MAG: DNA methyltransferase, partial [Nocardioides sp.]
MLDPACGCGNFLYVAYRELRGLEHELKERIRALARDQGLHEPPGPWPYYPLTNLQGLDIEHAAVQISRVTLWMGHRQMIDRYGESEPPLPLQDLSAIKQADALRTPWPETDCIVGNPPFLGAKLIRPNLGDDYADWLIQRFGVGVKDLCVYWFRRAHEHLVPDQRAG